MWPGQRSSSSSAAGAARVGGGGCPGLGASHIPPLLSVTSFWKTGDFIKHTQRDQLVFSSPPTVGICLFSFSPTHAPWLLAHKIQSPQEKEALYALTVLETCMNHCGEKFHNEVAKFRFLNELIKVLSPKVSNWAWSCPLHPTF
uniref:VHS domain-containing protein n=1 Tax=Spermophilus dauricus TaxID=99837 RepID=A0A8C9P6Z9_SPEDA